MINVKMPKIALLIHIARSLEMLEQALSVSNKKPKHWIRTDFLSLNMYVKQSNSLNTYKHNFRCNTNRKWYDEVY